MVNIIDAMPSSKRLEALTDGIYAIAMTLLVLNIEIPVAKQEVTSSALNGELLAQWPLFVHYVISFVLLGVFWNVHHIQFNRIKRVNRTLLWINVFELMFVALIPFTTSFVADYGDFLVPALLFHLNILIVGGLSFVNYYYATARHHLVDKDLDPAVINEGRIRSLVVPAIACMSLLIAFINPRWSSTLYAAIPFILAGQYGRRYRRKKK